MPKRRSFRWPITGWKLICSWPCPSWCRHSEPGLLNPALLAHGISIALYNTAFGLMIAIPALIFWRYFRGRIDGYLLIMELAADRFARHLTTLRK